jgi:hypothetical protein
MTTSTIDHIQKEILSEFALRSPANYSLFIKAICGVLLALSIPTTAR